MQLLMSARIWIRPARWRMMALSLFFRVGTWLSATRSTMSGWARVLESILRAMVRVIAYGFCSQRVAEFHIHAFLLEFVGIWALASPFGSNSIVRSIVHL